MGKEMRDIISFRMCRIIMIILGADDADNYDESREKMEEERSRFQINL